MGAVFPEFKVRRLKEDQASFAKSRAQLATEELESWRNAITKQIELIERAYGFSAYQVSMLVFDPISTKEEVDVFFPRELVAPTEETVPERSAFGTHWGLIFFIGDDPIKMRDLLKAQEELDFYV